MTEIRYYLLTIALAVVSGHLSGQPYFVNAARASGIEPMPAYPLGNGLAAADFDQDGDVDLFVCSDDPSPNHLYINLGNGHFTESAQSVGLGAPYQSRIALWVDYDADHRLDLIVLGDCKAGDTGCSTVESTHLYHQLEDHTFEEVSETSGIRSGRETDLATGGVAAGDLNLDGYPDIVITYLTGHTYMYINNGNGSFTEKGLEKLDRLKARYLQPVIFDLDGNHFPDILISVDGEENRLWLNYGNLHFREMAKSANINSPHSDMGIALGDYENDGDIDVYITNVFGEDAVYNKFFRNDTAPDHGCVFNETAKSLGVDNGGWGWGTTFLDANNDGLPDLAENNGYYANWRQHSRLWINNGDHFEDRSEVSGLTEIYDGNTLIAVDYDRDGDLDMIETSRWSDGENLAVRMMRNDLKGSATNYLVIKPRMVGSNHYAIGAKVSITTQSGSQIRPVTAGISYNGQEPSEAFFGLGSHDAVEEITITWPGGTTTSYPPAGSNQVLTLTDELTLHRPNQLSVIKTDTNEVSFQWTHISSSESGFIIQRSDDEAFTNPEAFSVSNEARSFKDSGLDKGVTYHYRIKAISDSLASAYSKVLSLVTEEYLEAPVGLTTGTSTPFSVNLAWEDRSDNEINFIVQRDTSRYFEHPTEMTTNENTANHTDRAVLPNTRYYYRVAAKGTESRSAFSEFIEVLTPDYIEAPTALTTERLTGTSLLLTWKDNSVNETGFMIEKSLTDRFLYVHSYKVGANLTRFTDRDVFPENVFYYRVKAYNENTESAFTNIGTTAKIILGHESEENRLSLFPNPSHGPVQLELISVHTGKITLEITSITGQLVYKKAIPKRNRKLSLAIDHSFDPGIYLVKVVTDHQVVGSKLIIIR